MDVRWREPCCVLKMVTCQQEKRKWKRQHVAVISLEFIIFGVGKWGGIDSRKTQRNDLTCLSALLLPAAEAQCKPYYSDYSRFRLLIHQMCTSHYLDLFITGVIGLNVITMAMEHYQQPKVLGQRWGESREGDGQPWWDLLTGRAKASFAVRLWVPIHHACPIPLSHGGYPSCSWLPS